MNYKVIYELELGAIQYQLLIIPISIIFFGFLLARLIKKFGFKTPLEFVGIKPLISSDLRGRFIAYLITGFGFIVLIVLLIKIPIAIIEKKEIKNAIANGQIQVVEGKVEYYYPLDINNSTSESWEIGGVVFNYSDYNKFYGYHATSKLSEVLNGNNQYMRISYYKLKGENLILKIEELINY